MFSISGLRGIVGKDLTPRIICGYAETFGRYLKPGRVVVGRDARKSGKIFLEAVTQGLTYAGCTIIDLGIVPTPTVLFMVKRLRAKGGIVITASHNPSQWNALKFVSPRGQFLNQQEFHIFADRIRKKVVHRRIPQQQSKATSVFDGVDKHIEKTMRVLKPKKEKLRVGVDAVNGAGSIALPKLLEVMGCKVYRINCKFSPHFPRKPEPTPENIKGLSQLVRKKGLDLGFACDPDCDRLSLVDEHGRTIGEEKSLVLATDFILGKTKGNVVTNLSTTALMDYITRKHTCRLYRTKVGEANVVSMMKKTNAIIGGEGNGGIIYPRINFTRDALVGAAIIVTYPQYYMVKKKVRIPREHLEVKQGKIVKAFKGKLNRLDGLRITADDYWLHIRPSQTEPLIRIIGEARNRHQIEEYTRKIIAILR
jgi:phosphomannomutase